MRETTREGSGAEMIEFREQQSMLERAGGEAVPSDADLLWQEAPLTIREDDLEFHELGFIIEDHDDRRTALLESGERREEPEPDELLETNSADPLLGETESLALPDVLETYPPAEGRLKNADAERDEAEFASANSLLENDCELSAPLSETARLWMRQLPPLRTWT
jgi:hypothetical protein